MMARLDQVGAHPTDLSAVLREREDVQELMLHGCGLLYRAACRQREDVQELMLHGCGLLYRAACRQKTACSVCGAGVASVVTCGRRECRQMFFLCSHRDSVTATLSRIANS